MSLRAIRYQCPFHLLCSYVPTTSLSTHTRHNYYWKCMTPTITHNNSTKPLRKEFPVKRPISMSCIGVSIYSQFVLYSLPLCDAPFNSTNDNDLRNRIHECPSVPLATTRTLRSLNSLFTNTFPELDLFLTLPPAIQDPIRQTTQLLCLQLRTRIIQCLLSQSISLSVFLNT